jgi:hypothetical protein
MNDLFNSVVSSGYNYVTFIILLLVTYIFSVALIKIITENIIKVILSIRAPVKLVGKEVSFRLDESEK